MLNMCWKIMNRLFYFIMLTVLYEELHGKEFRQEGAVIKSCNNKYFINCSAITRRMKRGEPYRTNITFTALHPLYNNVTFRLTYGVQGYRNMLSMKTKACDLLNIKWLRDYYETFSNIPLKCPLLPGSYGLFNMEFPPKNFPLPIPPEDLYLTTLLEMTESKELIFECFVFLRSV